MIYVMSDIHGNSRNFDSVMTQIDLQPEDTLYVLGDVIDRYPDGIRILRRIMKMPNAKMLLGNHEYMMLEALDSPFDPIQDWMDYIQNLRQWYDNGGRVTHEYLKHIRKAIRTEIFAYLRACPLNIDLEVNGRKFKLAHASPLDRYEFYGAHYRNAIEFAVWHRWHPDRDTHPDGYTLIFGHTPTYHYQRQELLELWYSEDGKSIAIDCGSGFPSAEEQRSVSPKTGRLACLRLDDMAVFYSETL